MKSAASTALLCSVLLIPAAQRARAQTIGDPKRASATLPGEIRGRLAEVGTGRGMSSGSVTVRRSADSAFMGGALPRADGSFQVDGLAPGRYTVRIRALGYAPVVRSALVTVQQPLVDLGTVTVSPVAKELLGQVVVGERDDVSLAPDRNSYSTKNMTTASGGTAIDVLRNVPSVEVDGTNNISVRGNANVVVQINGRSSPLKGEQLGNFLAQLPASSVKNVEVATNPSAKNDPEGTAGIINIVLNQEAELGLSGGLTAGTGTSGVASLSGNLGRQSGPLTLVLSGSVSRDHRFMSGSTSRTNLAVPIPAYVESRSDGSFTPTSSGMTFRSEYRLRKDDALSFDALAYRGRFGSEGASYYTDLNSERGVIGLFDQFNDQVYRNSSQDYTVAFRRTGGAESSTFSSEVRYSDNNGSNDTQLAGELHLADASTGSAIFPRERDHNSGHYPAWNLQSDYTHPFKSGVKLETGFKGTQRHTANGFTAAYYDSASALFTDAPSRGTSFDYREQIAAVYALLSQKVQKVQLQAGLRLENAATTLDLPTMPNAYTNGNRYGSAFPSAIVSYNLTELRQAKVSYSRRISRPNPFQLSPIEQRRDARSVFRGNPGLRPEYTDALELGFQDARGWGSVQVTPYVRHSTNAVRYIQSVDTTGVTLSTFDNLASTITIGSDVNVNYHRGALTLFTGGSIYRYSSDASNLAGNLSARATVWTTRANATWKFSPRTDVQLFANYRAPVATEGGAQTAFVFMNVAMRQKLWGEQGNVSLRLADPFNLMKFGYRTESIRVIEQTERHFGQRGLFLTITRNFGEQLKLRPRQDEPQPAAAPTPGGP